MWTLLNTSRRSMDYAGKLAQKWLVRSVLITLITWFGGPTPGAAQDTGDATTSPPMVYVSNGGGGITEVNTANNSVIATAPFPSNCGQGHWILPPEGQSGAARIYCHADWQ